MAAKLYGALCIVGESMLVNYMVIPFQMLAFNKAFAAWKSMYFMGHAVITAIFIVSTLLPSSKKTNGKNGKGEAVASNGNGKKQK